MQNYDHYGATYGGRYVAVYKEQIVGDDKDLVRLTKRVGDKPVFIQYIYKERPELIL
jgi:hypothetical protein